jgi:glutamate carboxypeptidase
MAILDDLKKLVECESPTENLDACRKVIEIAKELAKEITGSDAEVFDENGRPVFWLGSKNPKIVLLAHLDTVWPIGSFQPIWRVDGDIVFGPGTFDMKAGFVQALHALSNISLSDVALIANTDEEVGSQTSRELIKKVSANAKSVLVLESSINGKVKTARKGTAMYRVVVTGKASHAGLEPEKGINATVEIANQISKIVALENIQLGTTVVPTSLVSGTTSNTVPAQATLDIDVRSFATSELERVDKFIRDLSPTLSGAKIEITGGINRPPLEEKSTLKLYEKIEASAMKLGMAPVGHIAVGGASDGNFAAAAGAQVLDGLGAIGDGAHAPHEQISISGMNSQVKLLNQFVRDLLSE